MENKDLKTLQRKILKTKKDLKDWEAVFAKKHGRPPAVKDISERPNIEKFYKKYNQLKKEFKQETQAELLRQQQLDSQTSPSHMFSDTQQSVDSTESTQPGSPGRNGRRRSSVEFVRSPNHPMGSRLKPSVFDSNQHQLSVRRLSEIEEMKTALANASTTTTTAKIINTRNLAEDEAFWLDIPMTASSSTSTTTTATRTEITSSSQPVTASFSFSQPEVQQVSSSQQQPQRLILGSSQPKRKKNLKQQKLFGRNPFQRAISSSQDLYPLDDSLPPPTQPILSYSQTQSQIMSDMIPDDEDDDDMEGVEVVTHEIDPFRMYDPSLFHWEDPTFSIGPGFFSSASPCYLIPILNEPTRRDRVLRKLEKGTLGEVLEENQSMEEDIDEDIRNFISTNSKLDSLESALTPIDDNLLKATEYTYKKKPIQRRQTRLNRLKFVDTSS